MTELSSYSRKWNITTPPWMKVLTRECMIHYRLIWKELMGNNIIQQIFILVHL